MPVGLAFFVVDEAGGISAHYPSPAGATRWDVDPEDWQALRRECPALDGLIPLVEALLVNAVRGGAEAWIVPVSECYRLVGLVRQGWEGLSGGTKVWTRVEEFFDQLRRSDGDHTAR